jgi:hypothetical protein
MATFPRCEFVPAADARHPAQRLLTFLQRQHRAPSEDPPAVDARIQKLILEASEAAWQEEQLARKGDELLTRARALSTTVAERIQRLIACRDRQTSSDELHTKRF